MPKTIRFYFKKNINIAAFIGFVALSSLLIWVIDTKNTKQPNNFWISIVAAALIAAVVSLLLYITSQLITLYSKVKKYKIYEGVYEGFAYIKNKPEEVGEEEYNQLEAKPVSSAELTYLGDNRFNITLWNPVGDIADSTHVWTGEMVVNSENLGDISFRYVKPPKLDNSVGYKKVVMFKAEPKIELYMFSTDEQRFGREVLVKKNSNEDKDIELKELDQDKISVKELIEYYWHHSVATLLASLFFVLVLLPMLFRLNGIESFFNSTNNKMFIGVGAVILLLLGLTANYVQDYFVRYKNTIALKHKDFLMIDDFLLFVIFSVFFSLILRSPHSIKHSSQFAVFTLVVYVLILVWLILTYFILKPVKIIQESYDDDSLSDEPIVSLEQDQLGRRDFVERLTKEIIDLPFKDTFVFGLNGQWGQGKTSVLNLTKQEMKKNDKFLVIEYTPWYYENNDAMLSAFYGLIEQSIGRRYIMPDLKKVLIKYQDVIKNGIKLTGLKIDFSMKSMSPESLKHKIEKYLLKTDKRLLIMVDELDRLHPDELLFVMQLVRLNTNLKNTIFLLAFEQAIVQDTLKDTFAHDPRYLEKIIQKPLSLPAINQTDIDTLVDKYINILFDELGISKERIDKFSKDFPYVYQSQLRPFFPTVRAAKRYINSIRSTLPPIVNEVDLKDFMILELIRLIDPNIYQDIWQHPWYYIPTDWKLRDGAFLQSPYGFMSDDTDKYEDIKKHLEGMLGKSGDPRLVQQLLEEIFFIEVKNALARTHIGYSEMSAKYRTDQRITHPDVFQKYFLQQVPKIELSDDFINKLLASWKKVKKSERKKMILSAFEHAKNNGTLLEVLNKLMLFVNDTYKDVAQDIIEVISQNIDMFTKDNNGDIFTSSEYERALGLIFRLLNDHIEPVEIQTILEKILKDSNNLTFVARVTAWSHIKRDGSLTTIRDNVDFNKLKAISKKRLDDKFIKKDINIFKVYPDQYDWGPTIYQWATDWQTSNQVAEVNDYIVKIFENNPDSFITFLSAEIDRDPSRTGGVLRNWRLDDMAPAYDLNKLKKVAIKLVNNKDIAADDIELIQDFIKLVKTYRPPTQENNSSKS